MYFSKEEVSLIGIFSINSVLYYSILDGTESVCIPLNFSGSIFKQDSDVGDVDFSSLISYLSYSASSSGVPSSLILIGIKTACSPPKLGGAVFRSVLSSGR